MNRFSSRPYAGADDLLPLIDFSRTATFGRAPGLTYLHPGDVVWQFYRAGPDGDAMLWEDASGLAGYAAFEPPLFMQFDLRDDLALETELVAEMLEWLEARCRAHTSRGSEDAPIAYSMLGDRTLSTEVLESDAPRMAFLEGRGYRRGDRHGLRFRQRMDHPIPELPLPPGMRLRHVMDADIEERVEVHRDAWSVWGPSSFDEAAYRLLRKQPVYDPELDIVLEGASGRFLSYCICWGDAASGVALFEPVGTRPEFAGRGLARLVILEALRRVRRRGFQFALVATASVNERAARLYPACGFELVERQYSYSKQL